MAAQAVTAFIGSVQLRLAVDNACSSSEDPTPSACWLLSVNRTCRIICRRCERWIICEP